MKECCTSSCLPALPARPQHMAGARSPPSEGVGEGMAEQISPHFSFISFLASKAGPTHVGSSLEVERECSLDSYVGCCRSCVTLYPESDKAWGSCVFGL